MKALIGLISLIIVGQVTVTCSVTRHASDLRRDFLMVDGEDDVDGVNFTILE